MIWNIETPDDDGNAANFLPPDLINEDEIGTLYDLLNDTKADHEKFLKVLRDREARRTAPHQVCACQARP